MRFVSSLLIVALVAGVQQGCASASNDFAAPRITAQNLVALPATAGQQRFRVGVLIDNPNPEPLLIRDLQFQLRLADQGILDGRSTEPLTVAALDRHTLTLELRSDIISSVSRLLSFVQGPENALPYELYGRVTLERALKEPIAFSARGLVPLAMNSE
jgi:LEA14-like dessication related protein